MTGKQWNAVEQGANAAGRQKLASLFPRMAGASSVGVLTRDSNRVFLALAVV